MVALARTFNPSAQMEIELSPTLVMEVLEAIVIFDADMRPVWRESFEACLRHASGTEQEGEALHTVGGGWRSRATSVGAQLHTKA